jgi:hypothetical protein
MHNVCMCLVGSGSGSGSGSGKEGEEMAGSSALWIEGVSFGIWVLLLDPKTRSRRLEEEEHSMRHGNTSCFEERSGQQADRGYFVSVLVI